MDFYLDNLANYMNYYRIPYLAPSTRDYSYSNDGLYYTHGYYAALNDFSTSFRTYGITTMWKMMDFHMIGDHETAGTFASQQDGDNFVDHTFILYDLFGEFEVASSSA